MSDSFQQCFNDATRKSKLYIKTYYDTGAYSGKSHATNIRSILARIKAQFKKAIDEEIKFPKIAVFVLDDDIIKQLKVNDNTRGITTILQEAISWLFREIDRLIQGRKDQLPESAIKDDYPRLYWVEAPQHIHFRNNLSRRKLNSTIQNESSRYLNSKIIRMKKIWDAEHRNLFTNNRFTAEGLMRYWSSIDNAVEYNDTLYKSKPAQNYQDQNAEENQKDRFHWSKHHGNNSRHNNYRFKLPKPNNYN